MTSHQLLPDDHELEPLEAGGTWLLDLVAAVDHLRRGVRPDITVWDAIEEALRWHTPSADGQLPDEPGWGDPNPLRTTLIRFLQHATGPASAEAQVAVRHWIVAMAARYNDGHHWPHPVPRRSYPPPMLAADIIGDRTS